MVDVTKKIADAANSEELDSSFEENILQAWIEQEKIPNTSANVVGNGTYPATSQLTNRIILNKEVKLDKYRIDCIAYWYKEEWRLIEVKQKSELGPSVLGDLLIKSKIFEEEFTVNPSRVKKVILSNEIPDEYRERIKQINVEYDTSIHLSELEK
jgi:hypothetical protein